MIFKYYAYELVTGSNNEIVGNGIIRVSFFQYPSYALSLIHDKYDESKVVSGFRRIK